MICERCDDTIRGDSEQCSVCGQGPFCDDCLIAHLTEEHDIDAQGN